MPAKSQQGRLGAVWLLGTAQYGICLFGGGALWLLLARVTGFFGGEPLLQAVACGLLLALIVAEAWWANLPTPGHPLRAYAADFVSSAAIAGFGMAVVLAVFAALPRA